MRLSAQERVDFHRDIAPILETRCWYCHGEDEQEAGLRLDLRPRMLVGGDSGLPAVVPGKPEVSYLIDVVRHVDPELKMPPDEDKLPAEEVALLTRWVNEGAIWPGQMDAKLDETVDHWSISTANSDNLIFKYRFVSAGETRCGGLTYSDPAHPRALIRRASIVLTGLAPTSERAESFVREFNRDASRPMTHSLRSCLLLRTLASDGHSTGLTSFAGRRRTAAKQHVSQETRGCIAITCSLV